MGFNNMGLIAVAQHGKLENLSFASYCFQIHEIRLLRREEIRIMGKGGKISYKEKALIIFFTVFNRYYCLI